MVSAGWPRRWSSPLPGMMRRGSRRANGRGVHLPSYLEDAQASIVCRHDRQVDHGTHGIFIGGVVDVLSHGTIDPLFYVNSRYTVASPLKRRQPFDPLQ